MSSLSGRRSRSSSTASMACLEPIFSRGTSSNSTTNADASSFGPARCVRQAGAAPRRPCHDRRESCCLRPLAGLADGTSLASRLLIDTGSNQGLTLTSPFVRRHRLIERFPSRRATASAGIGGIVTSPLITLSSVAIGDAQSSPAGGGPLARHGRPSRQRVVRRHHRRRPAASLQGGRRLPGAPDLPAAVESAMSVFRIHVGCS